MSLAFKTKPHKRVVIIGAGPAGAALATFLAREGVQVALFASSKRPDLIVGESLVPAVMPIIKELGIEDEVKSYSTYKPGAAFYPKQNDETLVLFNRYKNSLSPYAYNVQRKFFDKTIFETAVKAGAHIITANAKLKATADGGVRLDGDIADYVSAKLGGTPQLYIDATGRSRYFAKLLSLGEVVGGRKDFAIFSHLENVSLEHEGCIHINRLNYGWSWRIPLPGKISLGIVMAPEHLDKFGKTTEEQYDRIIKEDKVLKAFTQNARRVEPVVKYTNYQLVSDKFYGPNWVCVGDAAGFIDPIFSSGLNLALNASKELSEIILKGASKIRLHAYQVKLRQRLINWQQIVDSFYNGRLFGLIRAGRLSEGVFPWRLLAPRIQTNLEKVFSGMVHSESPSFLISKKLIKLKQGELYGSRLKVR